MVYLSSTNVIIFLVYIPWENESLPGPDRFQRYVPQNTASFITKSADVVVVGGQIIAGQILFTQDPGMNPVLLFCEPMR